MHIDVEGVSNGNGACAYQRMVFVRLNEKLVTLAEEAAFLRSSARGGRRCLARELLPAGAW
jgi:hypothetical protein